MKLNLHLRLSLIVALFVSGVTVIASYSFYNFTYNREQTRSLQAVTQLSATVYKTAEIAAYAGNRVIAEDVLDGLLRNKLLYSVTINTDQFSLHQGRNDGASLAPITQILYSPFGDNDKIGELIITPSRDIIDIQAKAIALEITVLMALLIIVTLLCMMAVIWLFITNPVSKLASELYLIRPGDDKRLTIPVLLRETELETLSKTVNQLLDKVQQQITEERKLRDRVELIANNFRMVFDLSTNALIVTDKSMNLLTYNPSFQDLVLSATGNRHLPHTAEWVSLLVKNPDEFMEQITQLLEEKSDNCFDVKLLSHEDGRRRWVSINAKEAVNDYGESIILIFINDITRQHEALNASVHDASHDHLTHLKNRRVAEQQIDQMIHTASRIHQPLALIVLDLDGFKKVNDTEGHDAGDKVLIEVANRLSNLTRKSDIVARWGGDEFVIALNDATQETAVLLAQRFLQSISQPIDIGKDKNANVGASIGIVICPDNAASFNAAFECADVAMYQVKQAGKNGIRVYNPQTTIL
nr:sensor domain-containing diguanylate cyclase [uncultured Tolumonas sp.]